METPARSVIHSGNAASLVDVLERILDKGIVVAGDITLKIVDIELLTIQIRLLVCSVDKAREMGMNWWMTNAYAGNLPGPASPPVAALAQDGQHADLVERVRLLENALAQLPVPPGPTE